MGFTQGIIHMALDPLGYIFVSFNSKIITKYTVAAATGLFTSNYSWTVPELSKIYATVGYVYTYQTGTRCNILRFNNFSNSASTIFTSAIYSNDDRLRFISCHQNDLYIYSTTVSGNLYSYSLISSNTTLIASNLDIIVNVPYVDSYTNSLYVTLTSANTITRIPLDGTPSSNMIILKSPTIVSFYKILAGMLDPTAVVYNSFDSNIYVCTYCSIRKITPLGIVTTVAGTTPGNADGIGSNAQFNCPQALCVNTSGTELYVADTKNSSVRKIELSNSNVSTVSLFTSVANNIPGLQLWLDANDPNGNGSLPANGSTITTWVDKSGNGYNAIAKGIVLNTFYRSYFNGMPGIQLSGNVYNDPRRESRCYFSSSIPQRTFQSGITMFIIFQANGSGNDANYCSPIARVGQKGNVGFPNIRGASILIFNNEPTDDAIVYTNPVNPVSQLNPLLYCLTLNPAQSPYVQTFSNGDLYQPGVSFTIGPYGTTYNTSTTDSSCSNIHIGWDGQIGYLNGMVYETLVYNRNLTPSERQQIESYLSYKWGFVLDPSHPYHQVVVNPQFANDPWSRSPAISRPEGIACDSSNLYISDTGNHTIKRYTFSTAITRIISGRTRESGSANGIGRIARFNFPKGMAINSNASLLYIADSSNYTVRVININRSNVLITSLYMGQAATAGFTASNFAGPAAVAVNSNGVLYITDTGNNSIVYARNLIIAERSTTPITGLTTNNFLWVTATPSSPDILYGLERDATRVHRYDVTTRVLTLLYTVPTFGDCIAVDTNSNTYVPIRSTGVFRNGSIIPGTSTIGINTGPICIDSSNFFLYAVTRFAVYRITLPSGPAVLLAGNDANAGFNDAIGSNARFYYPSGMCIDNEGSNLYLAEGYNSVIRRINLQTSNVTTVAGTYGNLINNAPFVDGIGSNARIRYTGGITQGRSGLFYFIDAVFNDDYAPFIRTFNHVTGSVVTLGRAEGALTQAFFVNPTETLIYIGGGNGISVNSLGYTTTVLAGSNLGFSNVSGQSARFNTPLGISFYGSNLIVADKENFTLRSITPSSNVTTYAGSNNLIRNVDGITPFSVPQYDSLFSTIGSLCVDDYGNIYVCDGQYVRKIIPEGAVITIADTFSNAQGITFDCTFTRLYISDTGNNQIKYISLSDYTVTLVAGSTQGNSDATSSVVSVVTPPVPKTIPGLQLWLDAADPNGNSSLPSDGSIVESWIDKSGKGYNTSNINVGQAAGKSNYYMTNAINGLGGLVLSNYATPAAPIPPGTFSNVLTLFAVYRSLPTMSPLATMFYRGTTTQNRPKPVGLEFQIWQYDVDNTDNTIGYGVDYNPVSETPILCSLVYTQTGSPSFYLYSNGKVIASNTSINPPPIGNDIGNLFILAGTRATGNGFIADSIFGEVLLYNRQLSLQEREKIEGYLAYKWGLPLSLSHPYYGRTSSLPIYTITPIPAQLYSPASLCIDRTNTYIYVADRGNNSIRQINLSTASTSTFIGSDLLNPTGLCIDFNSQNLYVADTGNNVIRRVVIATQSNQIIAGSTQGFSNGIGLNARFAAPWAISIDSAGSNVYVSDFSNNCIRRILLSNTQVFTIAGSGIAGSSNAVGTLATFNQPTAITLFTSNLYTGELPNPQVRRIILQTSNVTTLAGSNTPGFLDSTADYTIYNTAQMLNMYSNALYTVVTASNNSAIQRIPFTSYPSTTYTFCNVNSNNTQIINSTGRELTITVDGGIVVNSNLKSIPNISDIKTLYKTSEPNSFTLF
jgi:sugar lactone lactonase YvrE